MNWLQRPLFPASASLRDVLKVTACACMVYDHACQIWHVHPTLFGWLIGRLAFPLFAAMFAYHLKPDEPSHGLKRLLLVAFISQGLYVAAFRGLPSYPWWGLNILWLFVLMRLLIICAKDRDTVTAVLAVLFLVPMLTPSSYGVAGLALCCGLFGVFWSSSRAAFVLCGVLTLLGFRGCFNSTLGAVIVASGLFAVVHLARLATAHTPAKRLVPSGWFLWFYPVHLAALAVLRFILP